MKSDAAKVAALISENKWLYKRLKAQAEDHEVAIRELAREVYELKELFNKDKCDECCTQGK